MCLPPGKHRRSGRRASVIVPELPEAESIARHLDTGLRGRMLGPVRLLRADILHADPTVLGARVHGAVVRRVSRRGKRILVELSTQATLIFRLGMSGRLTLAARDAPIEKHTHLSISVLDSSAELRFCDPRRFGGVWLAVGPPSNVVDELGTLGPEPLELTSRRFRELLARRRQIKALLMDQRTLAGLGNIYCDESLHAAGIHPLRPANRLTAEEAARLFRAIRATLRKAIRHEGSTFATYRRADGRPGAFQLYHRVYGREGKPCRRCATSIVRMQAAGRSSFFCPRCQKTTRPSGGRGRLARVSAVPSSAVGKRRHPSRRRKPTAT